MCTEWPGRTWRRWRPWCSAWARPPSPSSSPSPASWPPCEGRDPGLDGREQVAALLNHRGELEQPSCETAQGARRLKSHVAGVSSPLRDVRTPLWLQTLGSSLLLHWTGRRNFSSLTSQQEATPRSDRDRKLISVLNLPSVLPKSRVDHCLVSPGFPDQIGSSAAAARRRAALNLALCRHRRCEISGF